MKSTNSTTPQIRQLGPGHSFHDGCILLAPNGENMTRSVYSLNLGRTDTYTGGVPSHFRHLIIQRFFQFTVDFGRAAAVDVNNLNISGSEAWVSSSNAPQAVAERAHRSFWKDVFPVICSWGLVADCDVGCKIVWIYQLRKVAKLPSVQITRPVVELGLFGSGSGTWKFSSFVALRRTRPPSRALTVTRSSAACLVSEERIARPAKLAS